MLHAQFLIPDFMLNAVAGDLANGILDPVLIFAFQMGVSGAAIAHVLSQ